MPSIVYHFPVLSAAILSQESHARKQDSDSWLPNSQPFATHYLTADMEASSLMAGAGALGLVSA